MATLHRIETLAGEGRYAVTFQRDDLSEQTAVVQYAHGSLDAAEASLPHGWTRDSEPFHALGAVIAAIERAREIGPHAPALSDVEGGWDVMMGNVVLEGARPTCTAHGPMSDTGGEVFTCGECGARAVYAA